MRGHAGRKQLPAGGGRSPAHRQWGQSQVTASGGVCPGRGSALTRYRRKRVRKGKDRRKAWKRRILPGCPPLAPGTADVPSPVPVSQQAEPGQRSWGTRGPGIWGTEMPPELSRPLYTPGAGSGARGVCRPDAGCGSPPPSVRLSILPAGPPLPQRNRAGAGGGGGWRQPGLGVTPLAGAASWGPPLGAGVRSRPAARAALPGRGYFRPGLGRAPRGPGSHQCAAFSLVRRAPAPAAGSPDPRSHFHGNSPRPWETLPGLSFPPRKREGREGEETSGSPLRSRGQRHDARAMGTAGGAAGLANVPAAQLPAPAGLCRGVPPAPWGSLPFPGRAGTQPRCCCPPAGSLGRTAGCTGSRGVREERPAATSCCGPRLPGPPKLHPSLCRGAAGRGLSPSPGAEEPLLWLPPPGSRLAPSSTGARHKQPIDWGHPGMVPSAPTSATRQLPPPWPRGHRGHRGSLALQQCITLISRDWHPQGLVGCLLHPSPPPAPSNPW